MGAWVRRGELMWMREGFRWEEEAWQLASGHLCGGCGRGALLLHRWRRGRKGRGEEEGAVCGWRKKVAW